MLLLHIKVAVSVAINSIKFNLIRTSHIQHSVIICIKLDNICKLYIVCFVIIFYQNIFLCIQKPQIIDGLRAIEIHLFTCFFNSFFFYFRKDLFLAWVAVWMGSKLQLISNSLLLWCWFSSMTWVNKKIIKKINCHIFHVHIKCKCFVLIFCIAL